MEYKVVHDIEKPNGLIIDYKHIGYGYSGYRPMYSLYFRESVPMTNNNVTFYYKPLTPMYERKIKTYDELFDEIFSISSTIPPSFSNYALDDVNQAKVSTGYIEHNEEILLCVCLDDYTEKAIKKATVLINFKFATEEIYKNLWKQFEKKQLTKLFEAGHTVKYVSTSELYDSIFDAKPIAGYKDITELGELKKQALKFFDSSVNSLSGIYRSGVKLTFNPLLPKGYVIGNVVSSDARYQPIVQWIKLNGIFTNHGSSMPFEYFIEHVEQSSLKVQPFTISIGSHEVGAVYDVVNKTITIGSLATFKLRLSTSMADHNKVRSAAGLRLILENYFNFALNENLNDFIENAISADYEEDVLISLTPENG
jgi:hypothetical protein